VFTRLHQSLPARGKSCITQKNEEGGKKRGGRGVEREAKNPRRVGNTARVIQVLECTKAEIRDFASLLNFKNNKSLQITLLIGFKLEF